jgi:hypothetical protein
MLAAVCRGGSVLEIIGNSESQPSATQRNLGHPPRCGRTPTFASTTKKHCSPSPRPTWRSRHERERKATRRVDIRLRPSGRRSGAMRWLPRSGASARRLTSGRQSKDQVAHEAPQRRFEPDWGHGVRAASRQIHVAHRCGFTTSARSQFHCCRYQACRCRFRRP